MLKVGNNAVTGLYKGSAPVTAIYKGSVKVYPDWTLVEGFESVSRFNSGSTARFSRSTLVAKSGSYSLLREVANVGFMTVRAEDFPVTSTANKIFSAWIYIRPDRTLSAACGLCMSAGTGNNGMQVLLDDRAGFPALIARTNYNIPSTTSGTVSGGDLQRDKWYRMEMELKAGVVYGRLYDSDGSTLIDSIQRTNDYSSGYLALGAYSGTYFDKIEFKNS